VTLGQPTEWTDRGGRTVGVEEELLLFTGAARPARVGEQLADDPSTSVEHELKLEQVEIASAPHRELVDLGADLLGRRRELVTAAADRGVLVAGLATSPSATMPATTPNERYARMQEQYGLVAADQLTCGTHVHVSVASRAEGIAAIDGVRRWVAVLLAMSVNSPFWSGFDTGYGSYRTIAWGRWPTAGPTARFGDPDEYDRRVAEAVATGAAVDPGMIYFDVRLSAKYPTVEFRVADVGQQVADSVLLAALCRAAVATAVGSDPVDLPQDRLRAAAWRAARFGLADHLVDVCDASLRPATDLIDRMLAELGPALARNGDHEVVRRLVDELLRRGTGADLQRADLADGSGVVGVVRAAADRALTALSANA
jgi:glutamate---cysteine ligase / carboxylate-amine ligase